MIFNKVRNNFFAMLWAFVAISCAAYKNALLLPDVDSELLLARKDLIVGGMPAPTLNDAKSVVPFKFAKASLLREPTGDGGTGFIKVDGRWQPIYHGVQLTPATDFTVDNYNVSSINGKVVLITTIEKGTKRLFIKNDLVSPVRSPYESTGNIEKATYINNEEIVLIDIEKEFKWAKLVLLNTVSGKAAIIEEIGQSHNVGIMAGGPAGVYYLVQDLIKKYAEVKFFDAKTREVSLVKKIDLSELAPFNYVIASCIRGDKGVLLAFGGKHDGNGYFFDATASTYKPIKYDVNGDISRVIVSEKGKKLSYVLTDSNRHAKGVLTDIESGAMSYHEHPDGKNLFQFSSNDDGTMFGFVNASPNIELESVMHSEAGKSCWQCVSDTQTTFIDKKKIEIPTTTKAGDFTTLESYLLEPEKPQSVFVWFHGGPHQQAEPGYNFFEQHLVNTTNSVLFAPNIRGSTNRGEEYEKMDNELLRVNAIQDAVDVVNYARKQFPGLPIIVGGESYGGFVALATLEKTHDFVSGLMLRSSLLSSKTLMEQSEGVWTAEFGEIRRPDIANMFNKWFGKDNLKNVTMPVYIFNGMTDDRIKYEYAKEFENEVRENGAKVYSCYMNNTGHAVVNPYAAVWAQACAANFINSIVSNR